MVNSGTILIVDDDPAIRKMMANVISILKKDTGSHFDQDVVYAFLGCLPQALLHFRGTHFQPEYVDDVLQLNMQ